MASESGRDDVCEVRKSRRLARQPRTCEQPHRLVVLNETAPSTKMTRLRGRVLRGQRLRQPFGHEKTQTFIAGLRNDGLVIHAFGKPATRCITAVSMLPITTFDPLEFEDCPSALECTNDFPLNR